MRRQTLLYSVFVGMLLIGTVMHTSSSPPTLDLELITYDVDAIRPQVAQDIAIHLNQYNHISISIEILDINTLVERLINQDYDLLLVGITFGFTDNPTNYLELLVSDFWQSTHGYQNEYVKDLYETWMNSPPDFDNPTKEVSDQLQKLDQIYYDEVPMIPLVSYILPGGAMLNEFVFINHNHPQLSQKTIRQGLSALIPHDLYEDKLDPTYNFNTANSYMHAFSEYLNPETLSGGDLYFDSNEGRAYSKIIIAIVNKRN